MRSKDQHIKHALSNSEREHNSKVYGVNRTSILCDLPHFDVTQHLPQDLMHILLEGVFHHVNEILIYLVDRISFMTLADINRRIMAHPYAYFAQSLPSCI